MRGPIYILETQRGGRTISFDSLARARAFKASHEKASGARFRIIEQTIQEREVA